MKYTQKDKLEALSIVAQCRGNLHEAERQTNIPRQTLRRWLQEGQKKLTVGPPTGSQGIVPSMSPKILHDWEKSMDEVGRANMALLSQSIRGNIECPHCEYKIPITTDTKEAREWMNTYARLYNAKLGGIRFNKTTNVNFKALILSDLPEQDHRAILRQAYTELHLDMKKWGKPCPFEEKLCKVKGE